MALKLHITNIEEERPWKRLDRNNQLRQGIMYRLYGKLVNEAPDREYFFIVSSSSRLKEGDWIKLPLSGIIVRLGSSLVPDFSGSGMSEFDGVSNEVFDISEFRRKG